MVEAGRPRIGPIRAGASLWACRSRQTLRLIAAAVRCGVLRGRLERSMRSCERTPRGQGRLGSAVSGQTRRGRRFSPISSRGDAAWTIPAPGNDHLTTQRTRPGDGAFWKNEPHGRRSLPILHVKDEPGAVARYGRLGSTKPVKGYVVALLVVPLLLVSACKGRYQQQYEKGYEAGQDESTVCAEYETPDGGEPSRQWMAGCNDAVAGRPADPPKSR